MPMLPTFNNAEEAIAALETKEMVFAFRYLYQSKHPYLSQYFWQQGYYREDVEKILAGRPVFFTDRVLQRLYDYGITSLGVLLTLMGEAHPADVSRFFSWRHWIPRVLHTVYVIDCEQASALLISLITNLRNDEFFTIGSSASINDSYEPLLRLKPDIVAVNHSLGSIDGLEGIRLLKPLLPNTAFLLRSSRFAGYAYSDRMTEAYDSGVDYIEKLPSPLSIELIPALQNALSHFREREKNS
jgi:hypothetical protein